MKKKQHLIILKILSIVLLVIVPIDVQKFYLTSGIIWIIMVLDSIQDLDLFRIGLLISILTITGMIFIFSKKRTYILLGYLLTYIGLISVSFKSFQDIATIGVLTIYAVISYLVIYLTSNKSYL
ncbi:hypothetical protein JoomaDRAFT_1503 [Galbibacter orientalis DSM 19592]|uniref:Uncharacterized protein n=1 Tax=Galbibacter orientalis DSM 19592 TaxID=926559 RepID=I3C4H5_9FLAO|nr:hypothetical protein [Galbibacter orientalis]EIJ38518.1 hypothetical protein JoomaDRAFT_1503 [Galbibacter orientalis DSM 19592]